MLATLLHPTDTQMHMSNLLIPCIVYAELFIPLKI